MTKTWSVFRGPFEVLREPIRRRRWDLVIAIGMAFIAQAIGIPYALLTRNLVHLVDHDLARGVEPGRIRVVVFRVGLVLVALALVRGVARWQQGLRAERMAQSAIADVRMQMFEHLLQVRLGYFDRRRPGQVLVRFVGDAGSIRGWISRVLVAVPADVLTILFVVGVLVYLNPLLALAAVVPLVAVVPLLRFINPGARRLTGQGRREQSRMSGLITEKLEHISAVRAAQAQTIGLQTVEPKIREVQDAFIRRGQLESLGKAISLAMGSLAVCAVAFIGVLLMIDGKAGSGDIIAVVWLTLLLRGPTNRLTSANVVHQKARVAVERIVALLERRVDADRDDEKQPYDGSGKRIRFARVGYRDQSGNWPIRGLTETLRGPGVFQICGDPARSRLLFELILRLRRPREGRIGLDRVNAKKLRVADIRAHIGWLDRDRWVPRAMLEVLPRKVLRSSWTRTEPIEPQADFDQVMRAQANDPKSGLQGASGLRLALSCVLAGDRPVLLLEEPLVGLDDAQTQRVLGWLEGVGADRLVVVASNDPRLEQIVTRRIEISTSEGDSVAVDV